MILGAKPAGIQAGTAVRGRSAALRTADEYEVARLALVSATDAEIASRFGEGAVTAWPLHSPLLKAMGMKRKPRLGSWFRSAFTVLRGMRRMRGRTIDCRRCRSASTSVLPMTTNTAALGDRAGPVAP
ncbi:hypothetical protein GCM10009676_13610 [Prauserella halophila]|uniref:DUF6537 domain-containing protein n=1 Tax=Prauserella halophila TaxID=185641 RepID=A0ABN1W200_9PSEU